MTEKDDRKTDHGTAGPSPQGGDHHEHGEEVARRLKFLREHHDHAAKVKAKVLEPPEHDKPRGVSGAKTK